MQWISWYLESRVDGLKQNIINSVRSEIRGAEAQAAEAEERKLNVILLNVINYY